MAAKKAQKAKKPEWELRPFTSKESAAWRAAVKSAQSILKQRKRKHPALFLLAAVGKQLYESAQAMYKEANKPVKKKAKAKKRK
mmetsp:Transcript_28773/g.61139  ORF Transcript_28773/g.61139 Transcript_28773/m.61139 type:complete len:84 (-) Transcript_28773:20-271(-)